MGCSASTTTVSPVEPFVYNGNVNERDHNNGHAKKVSDILVKKNNQSHTQNRTEDISKSNHSNINENEKHESVDRQNRKDSTKAENVGTQKEENIEKAETVDTKKGEDNMKIEGDVKSSPRNIPSPNVTVVRTDEANAVAVQTGSERNSRLSGDVGSPDFGPTPCRKKKIDLIKDISKMREIEEYVATIPEDDCSTIENLSMCLTKPFDSKIEKAKSIHRWITTHISYNVGEYFTSITSGQDANSVLKSRTSVCQGYSELFEGLCRSAGIPTKVISGYGKGYSHNPELAFDSAPSSTNHAWNAVYIDGEWRLVDCTWDAGYVTDDKTFEWHQRDFYFLTDPELFINNHFPYMENNLQTSMKWQLLDKPVDGKSFSRGIKRSVFALENRIDILSHKETVVTFVEEEVIKFCSSEKPFSNVTCQMRGSDGTSYPQCVCLERDGQFDIICRIRPTHEGKYHLSLFGSFHLKLEHISEFIIKCNSVFKPSRPFPDHSSLWGPVHEYQDLGFHEEFGQQQHFTTTDGKIEINIRTLKRLKILSRLKDYQGNSLENNVFMTCSNNMLYIRVILSYPGEYKLTLFVNRDTSKTSYDPAAYLRLTCLSEVEHTLFPQRIVLWGPQENYRELGFDDSVLEQAAFEMENGEVDISVKTHRRVDALTELRLASSKMTSCTYMTATNTSLNLKVRVPSKGNYELLIYVKGDNENYEQAITFMLSSMFQSDTFEPFFDNSQSWGPVAKYKELGIREEALGQGYYETSNGEIEIKIPVVHELSCSTKLQHSLSSDSLNQFVLIQKESPSVLNCTLHFPKLGMYKFTIFVKDESNVYKPALFYMINCSGITDKCSEFPTIYSVAKDCGVYLFEPLQLEIPANSLVTFHFRAPGFNQMKIGNEMHEAKENDIWIADVNTPDAGNTFNIFGGKGDSSRMDGLIGFKTV